jgi:hypothetical protein
MPEVYVFHTRLLIEERKETSDCQSERHRMAVASLKFIQEAKRWLIAISNFPSRTIMSLNLGMLP